jgi:hypothetical protein
MVASTNITGAAVRVSATDIWVELSGNSELAPASATGGGTGEALPKFATEANSFLGKRAGAVAMLGMASPTGYLDLDQGAVTGAASAGTGTVDGTAVTEYEVSLDPSQLADAPGTTTNEATAIQDALSQMQSEGYTGTQVTLSVDASGFIRQSVSVATFTGFGTVTLTTTFSDFGCAGTVLMPGQSGPATPTAGCTSPDTGKAPPPVQRTPGTTLPTIPTPTTPTTVPSSTPTTVPSSPPTTVPTLPVPLPTVPGGSTTTTTTPSSSPGSPPTGVTTPARPPHGSSS